MTLKQIRRRLERDPVIILVGLVAVIDATQGLSLRQAVTVGLGVICRQWFTKPARGGAE